MFNHLQTFPNLCNVADVIFWFGSPKRKTHKVQRNNAPSKTLKKNVFKKKKLKKKINNSYKLMKNGQIFTIQKSLTIKRIRFSKKIFFIWVSHLVFHYILSSNNKFGMWINIISFILWCSNQTTNPYFLTSKVHYY
jgi:hypothetical protein